MAFTQNNDIREAYDSVALLFADFSEIEEELEFAFGQFAVDFSSYPIPEITTFFGGFNYGVVTYDNNIAIGLENFLGRNSKYYSNLKKKDIVKRIGLIKWLIKELYWPVVLEKEWVL